MRMPSMSAPSKYPNDLDEPPFGSDTPTVIASTASPFKFTRAVLGSIDKAEDEDDFKLADQLAAKAGLEIPEAVSSIRNAPVRHDTVVEVADMEKAVKNFLNI